MCRTIIHAESPGRMSNVTQVCGDAGTHPDAAFTPGRCFVILWACHTNLPLPLCRVLPMLVLLIGIYFPMWAVP